MELMDYIKQNMNTLGYCPDKYRYDIEKKLQEINYQETIVIGNDNSFYFLVNYYMNVAEAPAGFIMSKNNCLSLNSVNSYTDNYKQQMFAGEIIMRNNTNTRGSIIYIEFVVVTPVLNFNPICN